MSPFASTAEPEPIAPLPRELAAEPESFEAGEAEELAVAIPSPTPSPTPTPTPGEAADAPAPEETEKAAGGGARKRKKPKPRVEPSPKPSPKPSPPPQPAFRVVGSAADPGGDAGLQAPAYSDLLGVTVAEQGSTAIVTVDVGGSIPGQLGNGEVMGLGVDLFLSSSGESDYQLFADGSREGWFAYLHGPGGFAAYQGAFRLAGSRMVFEVPWSALGDARGGTFSSFVDWSRKATPINETGEDHAPNGAGASFRR